MEDEHAQTEQVSEDLQRVVQGSFTDDRAASRALRILERQRDELDAAIESLTRAENLARGNSAPETDSNRAQEVAGNDPLAADVEENEQ